MRSCTIFRLILRSGEAASRRIGCRDRGLHGLRRAAPRVPALFTKRRNVAENYLSSRAIKLDVSQRLPPIVCISE